MVSRLAVNGLLMPELLVALSEMDNGSIQATLKAGCRTMRERETAELQTKTHMGPGSARRTPRDFPSSRSRL